MITSGISVVTTGSGLLCILKVRNNTDNLINKITFAYNQNCKKVNLKKLRVMRINKLEFL